MTIRDFPDSVVVKTPHLLCRGHRFNPWSGKLDAKCWVTIKQNKNNNKYKNKESGEWWESLNFWETSGQTLYECLQLGCLDLNSLINGAIRIFTGGKNTMEKITTL